MATRFHDASFSPLILLTSSSRFDFATYFWDANDIWRWKFQSTATTATSTNINCLRDFEQVRQDGFLLDLQAKWHGSMRHPQVSLDPRELVKQAFHGWLWSPKCPNSSKTMTIAADKLPYSSRVTNHNFHKPNHPVTYTNQQNAKSQSCSTPFRSVCRTLKSTCSSAIPMDRDSTVKSWCWEPWRKRKAMAAIIKKSRLMVGECTDGCAFAKKDGTLW
jgi:hypothetical protein